MMTFDAISVVPVGAVRWYAVCVIGGAVLSPRFRSVAEAAEWAQEVACLPASGQWTVRRVG